MTKVISEDQAQASLERIEAGKSTVGKESAGLGFRYNGPLRKAIISLIGRDRYFVVIAPKRGCKKQNVPSVTK